MGMGKDLLADFPAAREAFEQAGDTLHQDFKKLCLQGPEDLLRISSNLQPALLLLSVACFRVLESESGLRPGMAAGHSLGEYSALVISGAVDFEKALSATRMRGELMESAMPDGQGTMAAVLGLSAEDVQAVCESAAQGDIVVPANYNAPGQVVISGHVQAIKRAADLAKEQGARRVIPLKVNGAYHTELMAPAASGMKDLLEQIDWSEPEVPVVSNVDAKPYQDTASIPGGLTRQITSAVRWVESVEYIKDQGIETFIEPGPGKVLGDMIKRIAPQAKTYPMATPDNLKVILKELCNG